MLVNAYQIVYKEAIEDRLNTVPGFNIREKL